MVTSQCNSLDEGYAIPATPCQSGLHWDSHFCTAVLDRGNLRKLYLFPWRQQTLPQNEAMGGSLPRSLVDIRELNPLLENQDALPNDAQRDY